VAFRKQQEQQTGLDNNGTKSRNKRERENKWIDMKIK
jgi:hypothetical protein